MHRFIIKTTYNNLLKTISRFLLRCLGEILVSMAIFLTLASIVLSDCSLILFKLDNNQLLYLFTTLAQVIGSMFGLTLTAYVFFVNKFQDSTQEQEDDNYFVARSSLMQKYLNTLIIISIICGATLVFCVLGIVLLNVFHINYSFIINESVFLFFTCVTGIFIFGLMLLDPQKIDNEIKILKQKIQKSYGLHDDTSTVPLADFLKYYNLLEALLIEFSERLAGRNPPSDRGTPPKIFQALRILSLNEIVNRRLTEEINEIRLYRNGLVHGLDFNASKTVYERLVKIYDALKSAYDVLNEHSRSSQEWNNAIRTLYDV